MKSKTIISMIFLIITLSLISCVFSITEDFIALAQNSSIKVCRCSISENIIKVGNTGNINSLYSIKQEGDAAKWSIIRPKSFSLDEKKTKTLINPINIPCDAKAGDYDLLTYIETGFGLKKIIKQNVIVEKCEIEEVVEEQEEPTEEITEEVNETTEINETEEETEKDESSLAVKVLKWMIYTIGGFVVVIVIVIIILYARGEEERALEEISAKKKKSKKKASKRSKKRR